ncbi:hypothetical protein L0156_14545 [bacterium]|nr:hypothetical protein [bacterium]
MKLHLLGGSVFWLMATLGYAATYVVDATIDSADVAYQACTAAVNDCSLRGAILKANSIPGMDTIRIPAGTYSLTISGFDDAGLVGDLDVLDATLLRGFGGGTTIDSLVDERVIHIFGAVEGIVELQNLTITGGFQNDGAGVRVESGNVLISNCNILENDASSHSGGGIYNNGALTIRNSTIRDNIALHDGAGIYNSANGTLSLFNSKVKNNESDRSGGGLYNLGTVSAVRSTFLDNTATSEGGGIDNWGIAELLNCTVNRNTANANAGYPLGGGGIFNYGSGAQLTIRGGSISNNVAPSGYGGGILNHVSSSLVMDGNAQISGNSALVTGGLDSQGILNLNRVSVTGNTSTGDGGGLFIATYQLAVNLEQVEISSNSAGGNGGGIWFQGGPLFIRNSKISNNSAVGLGGGIYHLGVGDNLHFLEITDSDIVDNKLTGSSSEGGGLFNYTDDARLTNVWIDGNSAVLNGGGIKLSDSSITVYGSTISNNTVEGDGAGIHNDFDNLQTTISLTNSTISGNIASGHGGGIYNDFDFGTAEIYLFNVTIAANDALASLSDGIFLQGGLLKSFHSIIGQQVTAGADCLTSVGAVIFAPGNNLEEGNSCGFALNSLSPALDPLAENGGLTPTHALQLGSPAVDQGNPAGCMGDANGDGIPDTLLMNDQRGNPKGALPDLGSYEFP